MIDIENAPLSVSANIPLTPETTCDILRDPQALGELFPEVTVNVEPETIIDTNSVIKLGRVAVVGTIIINVTDFNAATSEMAFKYRIPWAEGRIGTRVDAGETPDSSIISFGFEPDFHGLMFLRSPFGIIGTRMLKRELSGLGDRFERVHANRSS